MHRIFICILGLCLLFVSPVQGKTEKIVQTSQIYTYEKMLKDLYLLSEKYPNFIEYKTIGKSTLGKEIPAIKLGAGKQHVLFVGSHHGREWLTSTLLMKMIESYSEAYYQHTKVGQFDPRILDEVSIWFVPMLNPDGVDIQQKGMLAFPLIHQQLLLEMNGNDLNFKKWKANGIGIDLNRQYPAGWKEIKGDHPFQSYQYYKGTQPLEAVEVNALVRFILEEDPLISVAYHSAGRVIYWAYKNDKNNVNRDKAIASKLSTLTGYSLAKPPKTAVGGGLTDWFITHYKRPAYTIEIGYRVKETNLPLSIFPEVWKRNNGVGLMIAEQAKVIKPLN
ncbi:M14 family zinc carboxypeptidase [Bacillus sp. PS06]|uniref:M14 family zinc carboxypeptidase n=1 Tax=Bacillus sp. PS06 TaxID=2764176 RepID=UPI00178262D7|nr:M14 family zinc carboxypeptidase [Bacillus sp. PS06]MBD8071067.1 carboxypeptidase [Bacillus sp. PS06]